MAEATGFDPVVLIQTYQAGIWRYLRALGCDSAQAEDITQETFLNVLQKPFQDLGAGRHFGLFAEGCLQPVHLGQAPGGQGDRGGECGRARPDLGELGW